MVKEFNPAELFDQLRESGLDPSIFNTIDESQFPKAPNFLEWAVAPTFLNTLILPKQVEIGVKLFCEYCPDCSNPGYIDTLFDQSIGNIKSNVVFLEHGVCPQCKATRWELLRDKKLLYRNELVAAAGQRGGKSKLVAMLATYVNHRYLKLPSPTRTFQQTSGDMFLGTFSGLTMDQCNRNLWSPFRAFMDASPWFQTYNRFLRDQEKKLGVELLHELQNSITYIHKNLHWYSTGSEARKMRGDTRIWAAVDELGWMNSDESKSDQTFMNADAVYTALVNSLTTLRTKYLKVSGPDQYDLPPPIMANVSSPSSAKDKIMRLAKDARLNTRILAFNIPTWEMNPDYTYESLREEFSHYDELTFNRDFGAEPPLAANPFLSEPKMVEKIALGGPFKGFSATEVIEDDNFGDPFKSTRLTILKPDKVLPRMLTFDLGVRKNSWAVCLFSLTPDSKPKLDFALAITPDIKRKIRANIVDLFENFTVPLVEYFNIKYAFFDRWQSLDQIERLKNMNVDARMHSLTYKEMESVRGSVISQSVVIPELDKPMTDYVKDYVEDKPVDNASAALGIQLLTVRDMGHKMTKPLLGDDDIFRAFCLGVVKMADPGIKKDFVEVVEVSTGHRVACLGTMRSLSDGGGGMYGGVGSVEGEGGKVLGNVRTRYQK